MIQKKGKGLTLVETMIVICIIGLLIGIALPNFLRDRREANAKLCIAALKQIESAKERWYWSAGVDFSTEIYMTDLVPDFLKLIPLCPDGGEYTVGTMNDHPTCSIGTNNTTDLFDDHEIVN